MISFLPGFGSIPIGEVLGTDINIGLLSNKKDRLPPEELALHIKKSGYERIIMVIPVSDATQKEKIAQMDSTIETTLLYSIENDLPRLLKGEQVTTLGSQYLPIESDKGIASSYLEDAVFQLQLKGYIPVLMQTEIYECLQDNYRNIKRLLDRGCLLQMDILSLTGAHGSAARKLSDKLIHDGYASFIGSGIATLDEHKKFSSLVHSRKLTKLLQSANIKNRELITNN